MQRIVFFNVGWMRLYDGREGDEPSGGGKIVDDRGGWEVFNFCPHGDYYLGYVQPPGAMGSLINVARLGAKPGADRVKGVTVAWVSKRPEGGLRLVGWYENATVFRERLYLPDASVRFDEMLIDEHQIVPYNAKGLIEDAILLDPDDRTLRIPRGGKGKMGQSNIWYAESDIGSDTRREVSDFIREEKKKRTGKRRTRK